MRRTVPVFLLALGIAAGARGADDGIKAAPSKITTVTVYQTIRVAGTQYAADPQGVNLSVIWAYVAVAALYAITFATFALSCGMWLFQSRELGGNEG